MSFKLFQTLFLTGMVILISACSGVTNPTSNSSSPTLAATLPGELGETPEDSEPTESVRPNVPAPGGSPEFANNDWFAAAGICISCHQNNLDQAANDVSFGEFWRSTMMANSAKDPYYLAAVSIEVEHYPELGAAIEDKCSTCHMPMAHFSDAFLEQPGSIFDVGGYLDPQHPFNKLALDGVSCTICHQIQDIDLGEFSSFSGGLVLDQQSLTGKRVVFGPFIPQRQGINLMSSISGFTPQQGLHLAQSEMCATCHNLYTNYVTEEGSLSEDYFPEQTPYSEWLNSDYALRATCQDCHMPPAEGEVVLSIQGPAIPRSPVAKHSFAGGNIYLLNILKNYGGELGVKAGTVNFDATIERTLTQLQTNTATLAIIDPILAGTTLTFDVSVDVLTGHKFPTSYPSRRVWMHTVVKDANGEVIFKSGSVSRDGAINGNDNDIDPLAYEPHYDEISRPEQVQIYEPIMQDVSGFVTTELLMAASYVKDNRLLPLGFDKNTVPDDIAPQGAALLDNDFISGSDTVTYRIDTGNAKGPFSVDVELLYQSIGYRWAQNTIAYDTDQAQLFGSYYGSLPNLPVVIAVQSVVSK